MKATHRTPKKENPGAGGRGAVRRRMKCEKCGKVHPTEDETGEYPGSAAPSRTCQQ